MFDKIYLGFFDVHLMTIEAFVISTYISILLLVGIIKTCKCSGGNSISSVSPKKINDDKTYNELDNDGSIDEVNLSERT